MTMPGRHQQSAQTELIGEPSQADKKILLDSFDRAIAAAESIIENGGDCQKAMNRFN